MAFGHALRHAAHEIAQHEAFFRNAG